MVFYRPVWVEINHKNLAHNFLEISRLLPKTTSILPVVKANAYGHGLVSVSKTLCRLGPKFLGVTSVEEALFLKKARIPVPALILGNSFPFTSLEHAIKNHVRVTVASEEAAKICHAHAKKLKKKVYAHAKIDTGMNRIGINYKNAAHFIKSILGFPSLVLEGIYTHFSGSADDPNFTRKQLEIFSNLITELRAQGIDIPFVHCANSAAVMKYPESHFSLVRPGISLYGISPITHQEKIVLKPVLSWKSRIVFVKDVPPQTPISYGGTFVTQRRSKIATAAFGYADGFRRSFSNKAQVLAGGIRVPVLGRVTMDMTMLDVTDLPDVKVGDEVVLIGTQGQERILVKELAEWDGTSAYEIFCGIASRVPRVDVR